MNRDSEFLIWLSKRLVYKYGENHEILSIVDSIIKKHEIIYEYIESSNQKLCDNIKQIQSLCQNILDKNTSSSISMKKNISNMKNQIILSKFEDIDIDQILKNK